MTQPPCRKPNLVDLMILVATVAGAFAAARILVEALEIEMVGPETIQIYYGVPFLFCLSFTHLVFRLRQPRPRRKHLLRQPGIVASAIALASTSTWFSISLISHMNINHFASSSMGELFILVNFASICFSIVSCWVVLWTTRTL